MTIKQVLFSLFILSTAANTLPEQAPKNSPKRYDKSFRLDIGTMYFYEVSLIHIGVNNRNENIVIYYKKKDGKESSFTQKGCTAEMSILLLTAEDSLSKRYMQAKYTEVYPKESGQEIPCVFCAKVEEQFSKEIKPTIIFDSTDLADCKRLSERNAYFNLQ